MAPEGLFHLGLVCLLVLGRLVGATGFPLVVRTAAYLKESAQLTDGELRFNLLNEPVDQLQVARLKMAKAFFCTTRY